MNRSQRKCLEEKSMHKSLPKYLFGLFLSGTNGIVASLISLPSNQIALFRALIGAVSLAIMLVVTHHGTHNLLVRKHHREGLFLLASGAAMGAGWVLLFQAYQLVGVGVSTLVYYCGPILVMALSPILFHTKLTAKKVAGFAVVACGAFLIGAQSLGAGVSVAGLGLAALTMVTYTLTVVFSKQVQHIHGLENASVQLMGSLTAVVVLSLLLRQPFSAVPSVDWPAILLIGFLNTAVELFCYFTAIDELPVQTVAVCGYLEPLSAVVLSALILHEDFGPMRVLGTVCILGGALWCELAGAKAVANKTAGVEGDFEGDSVGSPASALSAATGSLKAALPRPFARLMRPNASAR